MTTKPTEDELRAKVEQDIRDMFKLEAQRNDINYALSGVERGEMTLKDYEDDLSVAISNYFTKDLLPAYTTNKIIEARIEAYKDPLYWIKENKLAREQIVDILESRIAELKAPTHRKEL